MSLKLAKRGILWCLAFLLCSNVKGSLANQGGYEFSATAYIVKVIAILSLIAVAAILFYRYASRRGLLKRSNELQLIALLPLGTDKVYLIRCGNEVIGVFAGKSGVVLLGRWKSDEWGKGHGSDIQVN